MNASLIAQTKCSLLLYAQEIEPQIKPVLDHQPDLRVHPIQPLEALVRSDTPYYPYDRSFIDAKWDPILVLHSSGSTGAPRPIEMSHATFAVGDNDRNLPTVPGRVNQNWSLWDFPQKEYFFSPFPAFHLAGFSTMVMLPIYYSNATLVLSPPSRPPTGHMIAEIMDHLPLKSIISPPIIFEQLVQEPGGLEKCKTLKFLMFAGGPLSPNAGDALSRVTDVCQIYGSTETGPIQSLVPKREDWASLEWHPAQEAIMEPSIEGTFELIMHHNPALTGVRGISCNFPDLETWRTKDLFKPHPTKPGLWRFHGRADDIIVLSNGEKFNPVPSETQVAGHPLLTGALIIGNGYPQACLILEPKDYTDTQDPNALIEEVWPVIERANEEVPGHGKITRSMVLVASKDKPFERSPKGTVVRSLSGAKYEQEVAHLHTQDVPDELKLIKLGPSHDLSSVTRFVKEIVTASLPGRSFGDEDDLFVLGLDSLQTTEILSRLKAGITDDDNHRDVAWITVRLVYEHSSIIALAKTIRDHFGSDGVISTHNFASKERTQKLELMTQKYIQTFKGARTVLDSARQTSDLHVLLTGSTGSLGTQMFVKFASDPTVSRISCLDRSANARERVMQSLAIWPQKPVLDSSRIDFHQADYGKADFGLSAETFADLHDTVSVIVHNAWEVNFNHSVSSFEAVHIRGVRNFITFSGTSRLNPRIVFVSSISSVGNWHAVVPDESQAEQDKDLIPEMIAPTPAVAQSMGYAESKAISEQILAAAVNRVGAKVSIVRIGQIAGPIAEDNGGIWNEHEWVPLLLKTSMSMGKIPDASLLDNVDWLPVDVIASVMLDIAMPRNDEQALHVYHLVNPHTTTWGEMLPAVQDFLGGAQAVSLQEWVAELEKVDTNGVDAIAAKPAVKILDFFRSMQDSKYIGAKDIMLSTREAEEASPVLGHLGPVRAEWIQRWMRDWGFRG
jgi:thioester reductase-like protein